MEQEKNVCNMMCTSLWGIKRIDNIKCVLYSLLPENEIYATNKQT